MKIILGLRGQRIIRPEFHGKWIQIPPANFTSLSEEPIQCQIFENML